MRQHDTSRTTFFEWRNEHAAASVSDVKRLRELEQENAQPRTVVAERVSIRIAGIVLNQVEQAPWSNRYGYGYGYGYGGYDQRQTAPGGLAGWLHRWRSPGRR